MRIIDSTLMSSVLFVVELARNTKFLSSFSCHIQIRNLASLPSSVLIDSQHQNFSLQPNS